MVSKCAELWGVSHHIGEGHEGITCFGTTWTKHGEQRTGYLVCTETGWFSITNDASCDGGGELVRQRSKGAKHRRSLMPCLRSTDSSDRWRSDHTLQWAKDSSKPTNPPRAAFRSPWLWWVQKWGNQCRSTWMASVLFVLCRVDPWKIQIETVGPLVSGFFPVQDSKCIFP